ncbi:cytochrome c oxidase assembly protein [Deinococcus radiophilus]|uniref:Cytochrome c oxidase assembly protein n=1 Tax=Deinococcus radiophilus TaxID=32062 RepID=A0A3S0LAF8_9DEIO|nr:cytochrome c oxidase assembly protein [Deinococcus radiophilus]RTR30734.1 cytochrome c oxidase assembly protein [Deinococcus radiophilus]UFA51288.1 cytochrome c oxidase assembly protein [Deinococcus radiophilus]
MTHSHLGHLPHTRHAPSAVAGGFDPIILLYLLVAAGALAYAALLWRHRALGRGWPLQRSFFFALGMGLVAYGLSPALMTAAHADLRVHMTQHLLIGMFAPLALVLGQPLTLLLRGLPLPLARRLTGALHAPPLRWLMHPLSALLLNVGGMYLLYLTPLYAAMLENGWLHLLIHFHVIAAGFLYTSVIAGVDPSPLRASFGWRLGTLLAGAALHAVLGKFMFAELYPRDTADSAEVIEAAARRMYYWGDLAEALLAGLLFWGWLKARDR